MAIDPDGSLAVKAFVVPYWDTAAGKYQLKWFLYTLNRDSYIDVTSFVQLTPGFTFNGSLYNQKQSLRFGINMGDIFTSAQGYRFVQNTAITLISPATTPNQPTYFTVEYSDEYRYGVGVKALVTRNTTQANQYNIDISQGCINVSEWVGKMYNTNGALVLFGEDQAPNPTGIILSNLNNTWRREIDIEDVLNPVTGITSTIVQGSTLVVEFFAQTQETKLYLARAPLVVAVVNS